MLDTNPIKMSNGEVLLPVYRENSPTGAGFMISDDGFETWEVYPSVESEWPGPGIMAAVAELSPGELIAYLRNQKVLLKTQSTDYGRTWTSPEETDLPNPWSQIGRASWRERVQIREDTKAV